MSMIDRVPPDPAKKAVDKALKLLALADPNQNDSPQERANAAAALVVCLLSNGLTVSARDRPPPTPPNPKYAAPQPPPNYAGRPPAQNWKVIRSKYESWCRICGAHLAEGKPCAWAKGCGVTCVACVPKYDWSQR